MKRTQIVVFDDDPTGIQTVHGCLVITVWDRPTVRQGFLDDIPFFFVLTNTRAYPRKRAERIVREAVSNVLAVNREFGFSLMLISRSDSTLRSHFPLEVNILAESMEMELGREVDGIFLVPALIEGGRKTANDTHYLEEKGRRIPVSETEFADDPVFTFHSSHLPTYIEEKTYGLIRAGEVVSIPLSLLREPDGVRLRAFLRTVPKRSFIVVNAENYQDLDAFTSAVKDSVPLGKVFLFQSAASLVRSLAGIKDVPFCCGGGTRNHAAGVVVAGSYVKKTTVQLTRLLREKFTRGIEIDPALAIAGDGSLYRECLSKLNRALDERCIPVLYTSRTQLRYDSPEAHLEAGERIGSFLASLVRAMPSHMSFFIAKGGVTSSILLRDGFGVHTARVVGQLLTGVPLLFLPPRGEGSTDTHFVIFPGNVGDENSLLSAVQLLSGRQRAS